MTPTKLLISQTVVVFTIGVWAATQWAAAMLGYQTRLGLTPLSTPASFLTPAPVGFDTHNGA